MALPLARARAQKLASDIAGVVKRVEIVGSVRRRRPEVSDIELLVEPELVEGDLFSNLRPDTESIVRAYTRWGEVVKGGDRYVQILLGHPNAPAEKRTKLDLFICLPPASWGALLAIRTGPADLSALAVTRIRRRGWRAHRGAVWAPHVARGEEIEGFQAGSESTEIEGRPYRRLYVFEEADFFRAANMKCLPPERRDELVARIKSIRSERSQHGESQEAAAAEG